MMVLVLNKFLDTELLVSPYKAKQLGEIIYRYISKKKEITLDFSNIKTVSLAFLYFSFKDIKKEMKKEVKMLVKIKNPTSFLYEEIEYLKTNYKELSKKFNKIYQN